ncbi:sugar ABC transporter substrate-binding protein [Cohnella laeviribosi]|jgi:ribose transport system substrate-binding protein|uniref:sugar ABC transporter substrate-binding protein n=1 Tax=Cohnella laeviribosi TaxID=380174 RepID=UPI003D22278C
MFTSRRPRSQAAMLIALTALLLAACAAQRHPLSKDAGARETPEEPKKTIAYLPSGMTSPFYSQAAQSASQAGEKYGWSLEAQAPPAETDFNGQVAIFENFISKKVDGILFAAIDDKVLGPSILKANKAGIPMVVFNSLTPQQSGEIAGYVGYNQYKAGYAVGEYAGRLLNGSGEVLVIRGVPGYHDALRSKGFYDALKRFPEIRVVDEQTGDWVRDRSIAIAAEALRAHPDIDLIFGVNDEMAIGASIAARNAGKEVFTIGIDGNPNTMDEIEKGNLTATLAAFPDKIGETAMEQMHRLLSGEAIEPYLETPSVIVDRSNLEAYRTGALWTKPVASAPELWKSD